MMVREEKGMLKKSLEAKGVKYERSGTKLKLTFKYNSSVFLVMRKLFTEDCNITLSDKELFGMKDEFHQIVLSKEKYAMLQLHESRIYTILENQEIYDKILFEETLKESENQKEEQKYYKEKAIKVFGSKRELAQLFIKIQPLYYDKSKLWWVWNYQDFKWDLTDETDILNLIDEHAMVNTTRPAEKAEILEALRQESRLNKPKPLEKGWVQFKGTIVDIKTGGRFEASPRYFAVNPIPWELGDTEDTPTIDRLFSEWVGEFKAVTLRDIAAYCLLPDYPLHHIFFFWGGGCNGKSKYLEFIERLIGIYNTTTINFDVLCRNQFGTFALYKKLVCSIGETEFGSKGAAGVLKDLSGGNTIRYEAKNKDGFNDKNYAKLLIASNNLPDVRDNSVGWKRRAVPIKFPNQFDEGVCPLDEIPDEEYENFANKCVRLLKELLKRGHLLNIGTIEERGQQYEAASNPFDKFMEENIDISYNEEDAIPKFEFKDEYKQYLVSNGYNPHHAEDVEINKKMKDLSVGYGKRTFRDLKYVSEGEEPKRWNAWVGLSFKEKEQEKPKKKQEEKVKDSDVLIVYNYLKAKGEAFRADVEIVAKPEAIDYLLKIGDVMEVKPGVLKLVK